MNNSPAWIDYLLQIGPYVIKGIQWIFKSGINRFKWRGITEEARKIAFAIHSFSWINLQQTAPIIRYVGLITRSEIEQIQNILETSDIPLLLYGEAGSGKSGIALRLGQNLANNGIPVLFLRATDFPHGQEPVTSIQNRMALSTPLMDGLARLGNERSFAVIVDQLDSVAGTDLGKNFTSFLKAVAGIPKAKVLAVSRSYELLHDPDISQLGFNTIESGRLTNEHVLEYLSRIGLIAPSPYIVDLASNLLNLSMISEVVALIPAQPLTIVNEVELWKQYFVTIQQREGDEAAEFALRLAREKTVRGERRFAVQFPNISIRRKLLSRGILVESPGRRYAFLHEQLQDFLCAYSLLPEQPGLLQLINEFGKNLSKGVILWLHMLYHVECPDIEPIFIEDILAAKDRLPFYTRVLVLESLRLQVNPSDRVARVVSKHLSDRAYQRFFFENLNNSSWIGFLFTAGFFYIPPDPIEVEPGSYKMPDWPAGEYLARFADQYEEIVIEVIKGIQTENWRVQESMVDALMKITPASAADLNDVIGPWLNGRFSHWLSDKLIPLLEYLTHQRYGDAAINILESLITPVLKSPAGEYSKYFSPVRFRTDHYWINEYCSKSLPELINLEPVGVVSAFKRQLIAMLDLARQTNPDAAEIQTGYYWRMDIPKRRSEHGEAEVLDVLVDGLIDGLVEVCRQFVEVGEGILSECLVSEHLILQRIALHTLRSYGGNYPSLLYQAFLRRDYLETARYGHEYRGLMRDQFTNASEAVKTQVIAWIISGPQDLDSRVQNHAAWQNREATADDRRKIHEGWTLDHLALIRDHLSGEALDLLNTLEALHGKPDTEERPHIVITSWEEDSSPASPEELANKSFDELKLLFKTYVPDDRSVNSLTGLAQVLQGLVRADPTRYSDFAVYLIDPAIRFVYIYFYLSGFRESLKNNVGKLGDAIITLCEHVVAQQKDAFEASSGRHEPRLVTAQMEVAHLLENALRSDDPYLTREQLDRIRLVLLALAHHSDPETEDDAGSGFDPFTHSLNCVRGMAMHGIMHYSRYIIRQQAKLKDEKFTQGFLEPDIQSLLDEKLDLATEPSLAVHSVYGAYIPLLHFSSRQWLVDHLMAIFPDEEDKSIYWQAAWDGYIFNSNMYQDVFSLLIPQYQRSIRSLGQTQEEPKHLGGSPNERLAQHVMAAYLSDLTDFGHENTLLDLFFSNAPDPVRANGVFWLTQVLGNKKPSSDDVLWKKCWTLWQNRLELAETQEISRNTQEIAEYVRWLNNCPLVLDILYPVLNQTVKYLEKSFEAWELVSFAAEQCQHFPLEAVKLLQMTILSAKEPWWTPKAEDEEAILQTALASGNSDARQIAIEVINYRGEMGDFRWRHLLE